MYGYGFMDYAVSLCLSRMYLSLTVTADALTLWRGGTWVVSEQCVSSED